MKQSKQVLEGFPPPKKKDGFGWACLKRRHVYVAVAVAVAVRPKLNLFMNLFIII